MLDKVKPVSSKKEQIAQEVAKDETLIRCKQCKFTITRRSFAIAVDDHHEHIQCNPQGNTFVFRCFSRASGCHISGKPSLEFSWFPGYHWQYALCQGCGKHLGWYFSQSHTTADDTFFGLISRELVEG